MKCDKCKRDPRYTYNKHCSVCHKTFHNGIMYNYKHLYLCKSCIDNFIEIEIKCGHPVYKSGGIAKVVREDE